MSQEKSVQDKSQSVRLVVELPAPPGTSVDDIEALIKARLCDLPGPLRVIAAVSSNADAPSVKDLGENLSLHMLAMFPEMMGDQGQNMAAVRLMASTLGSILSFPLRNAPAGSREGDEAVEYILGEIRRVAYESVGRIREVEALQEFSPSGPAN